MMADKEIQSEREPDPTPDEVAKAAIQAGTKALDALGTVAGAAGWRFMRSREVTRIVLEAATPIVLAALGQVEAYRTFDGRLYRPEDIELVHKTDGDEPDGQ
jgi:hypothetical protein